MKNSFWILPMTLTLSMNTADGRISLLLLTSTPAIPDISLTRMISPLMMMASQSVNWAYVCTRMDMRLPNTGRNTDAQNRTEKTAASVSIPVHRRNMEGPYTSLPMTTQGYLTYRQGTLRHGKRNMAEGLLWNAPTSARKRTIN